MKSLVAIYCIKNAEESLIKENKYTFYFDSIINFIICLFSIFRLFRKIKLYNSSKNEKILWDTTNDNNHFFPEIDNKITMN